MFKFCYCLKYITVKAFAEKWFVTIIHNKCIKCI